MDCTEIYTIAEKHKVDLIRMQKDKQKLITPVRMKWVDEQDVLHDFVVNKLIDRSNTTIANYKLGVSGIRYKVDVTDMCDESGEWSKVIELYDDGDYWYIDSGD